jgi:RHS repeat-associated protein
VLRRNAPTPVQQVRSASTRAKYVYNGLNWRILKQADTNASGGGGDAGLDQQRIMYYSANWQLLQEFIDDDSTFPSGGEGQAALDGDNDRRMQYLWGPRYIDDILLRRLDGNADGDYDDSGADKVYYHCTDAMFSTVEVLDDAAVTLERVSYDPYGQARHHKRADIAVGEGGVNSTDQQTVSNNYNSSVPAPGDINRDGNVNIDDFLIVINYTSGLSLGKLSTTDNVIGWDGYVFNAECDPDGMYTVRHRQYRTDRWLERDPLEFLDSMNLYEYCRSRPTAQTDSAGLSSCWACLNCAVEVASAFGGLKYLYKVAKGLKVSRGAAAIGAGTDYFWLQAGMLLEIPSCLECYECLGGELPTHHLPPQNRPSSVPDLDSCIACCDDNYKKAVDRCRKDYDEIPRPGDKNAGQCASAFASCVFDAQLDEDKCKHGCKHMSKPCRGTEIPSYYQPRNQGTEGTWLDPACCAKRERQ